MKYLALCVCLGILAESFAMESLKETIRTNQSDQLLEIQYDDFDNLSPLVPKSQSDIFAQTTPIYDAGTMELTQHNLFHFMNINQPNSSRRTSCYANVLVYTIYSYICLNTLTNYEEENATLYRSDILNNLYCYRTNARSECLFIHKELVNSLNFLYDMRLDNGNYPDLLKLWGQKTMDLLENSPIRSTTRLLGQAKQLFYRLKPVGPKRKVKFDLNHQ